MDYDIIPHDQPTIIQGEVRYMQCYIHILTRTGALRRGTVNAYIFAQYIYRISSRVLHTQKFDVTKI